MHSYTKARKNATQAGLIFEGLLKLLRRRGNRVVVVAHSMGNRVALTALLKKNAGGRRPKPPESPHDGELQHEPPEPELQAQAASRVGRIIGHANAAHDTNEQERQEKQNKDEKEEKGGAYEEDGAAGNSMIGGSRADNDDDDAPLAEALFMLAGAVASDVLQPAGHYTHTGAWQHTRPCAHKCVCKSKSCMDISH